MARIKFGAIVTDGRGKLGGHLLSKNGSCNTLGTMTRTKQKHNKYRQKQKNYFNLINKRWKTLTTAQVAKWKSMAPYYPKINEFGDPYYLTAYQIFVYCNLNLLKANMNFLYTPKIPTNQPKPPISSMVLAKTSQQCTIYGPNRLGGRGRLVYASNSHAKNYSPKDSEFYLIPGASYPGGGGMTLNLLFWDRVPLVNRTQWVTFKVYFVDLSGHLSPVNRWNNIVGS